jgi:hypothetical protein
LHLAQVQVSSGYALLAMTGRLLLLIASASALLITQQVRAQSGIAMQSTATYQFGTQITFVAQISAPVQIQQANLVIFDESQSLTHVQAVNFVNGRSEYSFDTRQNLIQPFAVVRWYYELTLSDGSVLQSDSYSLHYDDNRFTWQKLEAGSLHVMWAQGDATFGQNALNAAQAGLQSINNIVPVDLTQSVDIFIYPTQNDLAVFGGEVWEAGRAYPESGVALVVIALDSNQSVNMERLIPHELMHLMFYRQLGAGATNLPSWLNEGVATLAEINPTADYGIVLQDANTRNGLIPMVNLCASFPTDPAQAFLAYAEARSFTTYLRDTYGAPTLLNLAKVYAQGMDCQNGAQRALGTSLAKLESDWLEKSLGHNAWGVVFRNLLPYLVLLGLLIFIPFILGLNASRQKVDKHGPEKYTNKR